MCKNEIKKGSTVILKCNIGVFLGYQIPEGTRGFVLENANSPFVEFDIKPNKGLHDGGGLGEYGKCWSVHINYLKLYEYKTSNRYKLQQAIKATGFHAEKLSLATGFKKGYFSDYTSESRFNSRGDITEDRLNSLLTTLAFAERDLRNISNKAVDDQVKPKDFGNRVENKFLNDEEIKLIDSSEYKKIAEDFKSGMQESVDEAKNALDSFVLYPTDKPELSKFTKVGIIAIVILLLILIVKNLVV